MYSPGANESTAPAPAVPIRAHRPAARRPADRGARGGAGGGVWAVRAVMLRGGGVGGSIPGGGYNTRCRSGTSGKGVGLQQRRPLAPGRPLPPPPAHAPATTSTAGGRRKGSGGRGAQGAGRGWVGVWFASVARPCGRGRGSGGARRPGPRRGADRGAPRRGRGGRAGTS
ncbi:MAG: hypothetical protein J3K34DRAFT_45291 [Monoraphidium minutum]|nr:MAG: hypothetical protein J3K34DRAFT_45291 [Monoraphidium minutum]